jgi:hypothetical protein
LRAAEEGEEVEEVVLLELDEVYGGPIGLKVLRG